MSSHHPHPVAFVLGGGGIRGAVQVGMLQALLEHGVRPDLVVGSSIGAINGAIVAAHPGPEAAGLLHRAWNSPQARAVYGDSVGRQLHRLITTRTHLNSPRPLQRLLQDLLGTDTRFEDLPTPLRVVAASIESAAEHWFTTGPLLPAVLASASVPGLLPPTRVGDEHYLDGGIVNSIPLQAALDAGARTVYVLHVGRVDEPLTAPTTPVETARVAFEIARRHRWARDLAELPDHVDLHVLPTGGALDGDQNLGSYKRMGTTPTRIDRAHRATRAYLEGR
ncbi:patatin-like phospholipase family protein [Nocardiopsis sp. HNM0947]|uniref:Patatin-like phospholipase family protein n=1 Tax=Nocardiopsis coralli TaxID=2772213 RepID=A0ABR9PCH9_9ACTN|nr:patatin-like phospholipase family protein [Nocardiopsis coralli]MBE3001552.1 patatin-like phospholipase family protein [Nocardiopsis coralli]